MINNNNKKGGHDDELADEDLEELISSESTSIMSAKSSNEFRNTPNSSDRNKNALSNDASTSTRTGASSPSTSTSIITGNNTKKSSSLVFQLPSLCMYVCLSFLLEYPRMGKTLAGLLFVTVLYALLSLTSQGKLEEIGRIRYDFTNVHSQYDFDIGKVDHWCVDHSDSCQCQDPLLASMVADKNWFKTHSKFVSAAKFGFGMDFQQPDAKFDGSVDVAFLGQAVVEALDGSHHSQDLSETNEYFGHVQHMFRKRFYQPSEDNHYMSGYAMGIAGDQANNVLWRLMHGELNPEFDPPFWWIVLGMEDLARYRCSEEIVIMGILRIVEEIRKFKPHAKIIVNGLFPMTKLRSAELEPIDFIDAERNTRTGVHTHYENHRQLGRRNNNKMKQQNGNDNGNGNDGQTEQQELPVSNKQKAKRFKQNMTQRSKERYQMLKEKHSDQQQQIIEQIKTINADKSLSKSKKKERTQELQDTLNEVKDRHHHMEDVMKKYIINVNKDKYNPLMKEQHTFHKDNFFHHHDGSKKNDREIPVWTAIHEINKELHDFCKRTDNVVFYDPTPLFTQSGADSGSNAPMTLLTDYMSVRGHPTREGYKLWLNDIQRRLIEWKIKAEEKTAKQQDDIDEWSSLLNEYYYGNQTSSSDGGNDDAVSSEEETNYENSEEENGQERTTGIPITSEDEKTENGQSSSEPTDDVGYEKGEEDDDGGYYLQDDWGGIET